MLIILTGLPGSGKSVFADMLKQHDPDMVYIVRPSEWYPDNISDLSQSEQMDYKIVCWEQALDKTIRCLATRSCREMIVLDTCGATPSSLESVIGAAKIHHHKVGAVFVATPRSICAKRVDADVVQRYVNKLKDAVLKYKEICDKLFIVRHDTLEQWRIMSGTLCQEILAL